MRENAKFALKHYGNILIYFPFKNQVVSLYFEIVQNGHGCL